ncbi:response regulator transcription factor [Paenibacillus sp. CAU 1782]
MIKVLIVDDDNLVRRGLISILPWENYSMEVVGEAKNGEKALEFLAKHEVDLLLTDLAMPIMSGMELMRIVRKEYPHIFVVVLTLHQDFEYIQECLRLGAIDYIAKVEMEQENFGEVIGRVKARILEEQFKHGSRHAFDEVKAASHSRGYAMCRVHRTDGGGTVAVKEWLPHLPHVELDSDLALWLPKHAEEEQTVESGLLRIANEQRHWVLLRIDGLDGSNLREIRHSLQTYRETSLFYQLRPDRAVYDVSIGQSMEVPSPSETELSELKKSGTDLGFIHAATEFEAFLEQVKELQLPKAKLMSFLNAILMDWNRVYYSLAEKQIDMPESFHAWFEVKEWLSGVREILNGVFGKPLYSDEVRDCIAKAVRVMHDELASPVHASEMAKRVNMSRSYFSQCFKDMVGVTFNDYLRGIRIDKAKEYLRFTQKTIQWITENTGYADQKYFSRVFYEKTGMLPSEYRQSVQAGKQMSDD